MLMSAKKSNIDTAKQSKKERVRVCKREKIVVSFVLKKLSEQIIEDTYEYSL